MSTVAAANKDDGSITVQVKWQGSALQLEFPASTSTLGDVKRELEIQTGVLIKRQKLMGVPKMAHDEDALSSLKLKQPLAKMVLIGSPEADIAQVQEATVDDSVVDDLAMVENSVAGEATLHEASNRPENLEKVSLRISKWKPQIITPPRHADSSDGAHKNLLVLDVDYTLFDHKSSVETAAEIMRPHLHDFLSSAYEHYDIIIWSATSRRWVELKMQELGVLTNPSYKIVALVDSSGE